MAVSTLTCALSFFVSWTYPLLENFWFDPDATLDAEFLNSPDDEVGCFRQRREACRNEVAARFDILLSVRRI
jgi:hypothetical protein